MLWCCFIIALIGLSSKAREIPHLRSLSLAACGMTGLDWAFRAGCIFVTMVIDSDSFHDTRILEVHENASAHSLDFLLDYFDWGGSDNYERRVLRFTDVTKYIIDEGPLAGNPVILDTKKYDEVTDTMGKDAAAFTYKRNKVEFLTNAGIRIIEFGDCSFVPEFIVGEGK
jgi:hypothetical protein